MLVSTSLFDLVAEAKAENLKYRLVYIRDGQRLVGYDNERGKVDHKHLGGQGEPYAFVGIRELLRDFWADVRRVSDDCAGI